MFIKVLTIFFVFLFNATFGPILWLYAPEILPNKGVALVAQINMVAVLIFGSMANILFKVLTPPGMYMTLAAFQLISFLYIYNNVLETKGIQLEQAQALYFPKRTKAYVELSDSHSQG
uniref:Uncharacterized protein n=1 Tax=Euplotes harpa TaxID=151035 RepID=A0A7S3NF28_9SPIT|mmetsp:Transcript_4808/g.5706  ORF Transcript_4808/g.5706 Transcript_4808/m.5706 type:complete len:118 (+) Transcript_4808:54-407(+)